MSFIKEDFLLTNETAKKLYHKYAENMPIIDYHCHIDPKEIYEDRKFDNITQIWLGGDHYKWRLIRSNGAEEEKITGKASAREKLQQFAEAIPNAIGNPMYHWTHLELKRYFGFDGVLNGGTAQDVWDICNEKLQSPEMSVRNIIKKSNVKMIGTTDDPIDTLEWHQKIAADESFDVKVLPSFRPDKAVNIEKPGFAEYIAKLAVSAEMEIKTADDVKKALTKRLDFFCENGCRATDHGMDYVAFACATDAEVEEIFAKAMRGEEISAIEAEKYRTAILLYMGEQYSKRGIVMQIHYNVQRNTNTRQFNKLGADSGFDCMAAKDCSVAITGFLNALDSKGALPKTILYSLNPNDNELLGTILGCFQGSEVAGKIQQGSAWWFNDSKSGMEAQMRSLANLSLLGNFVGMLTDSRSFLSYTRHEYFRRILCNLIGTWVENGEYPDDEAQLGKIIENICYYNAFRYFGLNG